MTRISGHEINKASGAEPKRLRSGRFKDAAALERHLQEESRCFGIVARELRTEKGFTEDDAAKRAKVSLLWLQKLEAGEFGPNSNMHHLFRVFAVLGLTPYELYKRVGEMMGPSL